MRSTLASIFHKCFQLSFGESQFGRWPKRILRMRTLRCSDSQFFFNHTEREAPHTHTHTRNFTLVSYTRWSIDYLISFSFHSLAHNRQQYQMRTFFLILRFTHQSFSPSLHCISLSICTSHTIFMLHATNTSFFSVLIFLSVPFLDWMAQRIIFLLHKQ